MAEGKGMSNFTQQNWSHFVKRFLKSTVWGGKKKQHTHMKNPKPKTNSYRKCQILWKPGCRGKSHWDFLQSSEALVKNGLVVRHSRIVPDLRKRLSETNRNKWENQPTTPQQTKQGGKTFQHQIEFLNKLMNLFHILLRKSKSLGLPRWV